MQFIRKTKENGEILLYHPEGGCLSLKCLKKDVRVLAINVPDQDEKKGVELLLAAETVATRRKKKNIISDFPDIEKATCGMFEKAGYEISEKDPVISIKIKDLMSSPGVKKILGVKAPGTEVYSLEDMLEFQIDEVVEKLNDNQFPVDREGIAECDGRLSFVVYDKETYNVRSVIFAAGFEEEIFVSLLFNFSNNNPSYTIVACKSFMEALIENKYYESYKVITLLTINKGVIGIIKRLMGKDVKITERAKILRGKKKVMASGMDIVDTEEEMEDPLVSSYQKNINEKYMWNFGKEE